MYECQYLLQYESSSAACRAAVFDRAAEAEAEVRYRGFGDVEAAVEALAGHGPLARTWSFQDSSQVDSMSNLDLAYGGVEQRSVIIAPKLKLRLCFVCNGGLPSETLRLVRALAPRRDRPVLRLGPWAFGMHGG